MGLSVGDPRLTERAGARGINGAPDGPASYSFQLEGFELAGWSVPPTQVRVNDLPIFEVLELSATPAVILGADILNQRAFAITKGAQAFCFADA
jgi:hypothetical protein